MIELKTELKRILILPKKKQYSFIVRYLVRMTVGDFYSLAREALKVFLQTTFTEKYLSETVIYLYYTNIFILIFVRNVGIMQRQK